MVMRLKFDFKECIRQRLLRKVPESNRKAEKSLETAYNWLDEAKKNLAADSFNSCLISSYLAMFHSARAILFKDGFREKSHACIARFLEHMYVKPGILEQKYVDLLDHRREIRHQNQYSFNFISTEEDCEQALETTKMFLSEMGKLINQTIK